jgi:hypothetical protein
MTVAILGGCRVLVFGRVWGSGFWAGAGFWFLGGCGTPPLLLGLEDERIPTIAGGQQPTRIALCTKLPGGIPPLNFCLRREQGRVGTICRAAPSPAHLEQTTPYPFLSLP